MFFARKLKANAKDKGLVLEAAHDGVDGIELTWSTGGTSGEFLAIATLLPLVIYPILTTPLITSLVAPTSR